MELNKINLYRITHIDNIPHVIRFGITHKKSKNSDPNFKAIGDKSLIDTRSNKNVIVDNGKLFDPKALHITLGNFIPFYFGVRMPMLYVIQNGGNFVESATKPRDIIYMACSLLKIIKQTDEYFFSDGHATDNFTTFYDHSHIQDLPSIIDWNAVTAKYWGGQENLDTKRKKQAEFLIAQDIPASFINGFVCYNEQAKEKLIACGIKNEMIKVFPKAYF